jgi:hypothetical protein
VHCQLRTQFQTRGFFLCYRLQQLRVPEIFFSKKSQRFFLHFKIYWRHYFSVMVTGERSGGFQWVARAVPALLHGFSAAASGLSGELGPVVYTVDLSRACRGSDGELGALRMVRSVGK